MTLEHGAQLAGQRLDPRGGAWIGDRLDVGEVALPFGVVDGEEADPAVDAHDRRRIARRQVADVGHLGQHAEGVVVADAQHDAGVGGAAGGADRHAGAAPTTAAG